MIKVNDVVKRTNKRATVLATFEKQSDSVSVDLVLKLEDGRTPYPFIFFGRSDEWEPVGFEVGKYYIKISHLDFANPQILKIAAIRDDCAWALAWIKYKNHGDLVEAGILQLDKFNLYQEVTDATF